MFRRIAHAIPKTATQSPKTSNTLHQLPLPTTASNNPAQDANVPWMLRRIARTIRTTTATKATRGNKSNGQPLSWCLFSNRALLLGPFVQNATTHASFTAQNASNMRGVTNASVRCNAEVAGASLKHPTSRLEHRAAKIPASPAELEAETSQDSTPVGLHEQFRR